jgi:hypothetical protein
MKKFLLFSILISIIAYPASGIAQAKKEAKQKTTPLFKKDSILYIKITSDFKALLKDRKADSTLYRPAVFALKNKKGIYKPENIELKVRGNFRRLTKNCDFPPLLLNFPKKHGLAPFKNQDKVKLVTHCKDEEYVLREYLVYKIFNLITDYSFKARLAKVTYQDSLGNRDIETKYGILLEDEYALAKRLNANNFDSYKRGQKDVDSLNMATVAVFQYMIANTDFSTEYFQNIKLLFVNGKGFYAVPYDFDHSGIVDAHYAGVSDLLTLSSKSERLYRGITYSPALFNKVFDKFRENKSSIYALYTNTPGLGKIYIKRTIDYLDDFYKAIDDPKSLKTIFIKGGGKPGTEKVVLKGLKD